MATPIVLMLWWSICAVIDICYMAFLMSLCPLARSFNMSCVLSICVSRPFPLPSGVSCLSPIVLSISASVFELICSLSCISGSVSKCGRRCNPFGFYMSYLCCDLCGTECTHPRYVLVPLGILHLFPESWGHEKHFFIGWQEEGSDTTEISLIQLIWISTPELRFCH
jgi:hypothetical protein